MSLRTSKIAVNRIADNMTAETEKEMLRAYKAGLDGVRNQMATLYQKYETNGVLNYADMAKYGRLDSMFESMNGTVKEMTGKSGSAIKQLSADVYQESYYRTAFAIEDATKMKLSYGLLNPKTIQAAVENPIAGLTLSETLKNNRAGIIQTIKQSVTQGLMNGESYGKMADRIKTVVENDAYKAERIARTEAHRALSEGNLASMEHAADKAPIKMQKMWVATLDDRTRDTHAAMDGQTVDMDEDFHSPEGGTAPAPGMFGDAAEDINCRCTMIEIIDEYEQTEVWDGEQVVPYKNYSVWAEEKGFPMKYTGNEPRLSPEQIIETKKWSKQAASDIAKKAAENEPMITSALDDMAKEYDAEFLGKDFKLKKENRIAEKLRDDYAAKPTVGYKAVQDSIGDSVRYTFQLPPENYMEKAQAIKEGMEVKGFTPYKWKNYWGGDAYKGINSNWVNAAGQKFELQFHTAQSFNVKEVLNHKIYEKARIAPDKAILQAIYKKDMTANWADVVIPPGVLP